MLFNSAAHDCYQHTHTTWARFCKFYSGIDFTLTPVHIVVLHQCQCFTYCQRCLYTAFLLSTLNKTYHNFIMHLLIFFPILDGQRTKSIYFVTWAILSTIQCGKDMHSIYWFNNMYYLYKQDPNMCFQVRADTTCKIAILSCVPKIHLSAVNNEESSALSCEHQLLRGTAYTVIDNSRWLILTSIFDG